MNIVVFGGGTAGWITALLTQSYYPNDKITLVESDSIGILGAGEGTTPHFVDFLDKVKIPISDLVKNCKATIKHGINFENWNGDNKKYFHSFGSNGNIKEWNNFLIKKHFMDRKQIDELSFAAKVSDSKKVAFSFRDIILDNENKILSFNSHCNFALHFDARLLAQFLRKTAEERGITRVEGELKSLATDTNGNIKQIQLQNEKNVDCDFVFDCSGFARLLIGKFFDTEWVSYDKHLPMNTALPFFINHDNDVKPQTDAIAMKYGWIWKIPVEGRYGCGYVFDSSFINEDQALKEAEDYFKCDLKSPKTFKFKAGTFKKTVVNNCMAVGLAQSFVEPLEATSIWVSYLNLNDFLKFDGLLNKSSFFINKVNSLFLERNAEVRDFLYFHYLTKRNDSDFWKEFRSNNLMLENVENTIEWIKETRNIDVDIDKKYFSIYSWMQVANGLQLLDMSSYDKESVVEQETLNNFHSSFLKNQDNLAKICISHKEFLEYLR